MRLILYRELDGSGFDHTFKAVWRAHAADALRPLVD